MITENEFLDLKAGDMLIGNDGTTRVRVIYVQHTSQPSEQRVLFETFGQEMFDTIMINGRIFDFDLQNEIELLNGPNVKRLGTKDALIAH